MQDVNELPFEQLFQLGQEKYNQMDYEEAQFYYQLAYKKKPQDDMIVMCYSNILKHNDKPEQARKVLEYSLKNNSKGSYKRYFELAEIQFGQKSIELFYQGISVAQKSLSNPFLSTTPSTQVKRDIAQAYASIAEICLTDLTNIPFEQVEAKCAQVLQKGKQIDPTCMDIHLQIANCWIEKESNQSARKQLLLIKQAILGQKQQYEDEFVMQTAKLFMEIGDHQNSIQILQKLNETQNNNPETIYLLGYCAFQLQQYNLCGDYIENYPEGQMIDQQVDEAMKQLRVELSKKLKKGCDQTEQCNENEEWEDVDSNGIQQQN